MVVEVDDNFDEVIEAIEDGTIAGVEKTIEEGVEAIDEGFEAGEDALGRPWEPLSPETIERKGHGRPLIDTGDMRDSVEGETTSGRAEGEIYSENEHIWIHEEGTEKIPRRPIFEPAAIHLENEVVEDAISDEIDDELRTLPGVQL